jgi:hypothetical protein
MPHTKNTYLVTNPIILHQEFVAIDDMCIEIPVMALDFKVGGDTK